MRIRILIVVMAIACAGVLYSQGNVTIKKVPITSTAADNGKEMFTAYCAVCHGTDGRGGGPAAPALKKAPADLTQLTIKNNGKYPDLRVVTVLNNGPAETLSHGSKDMPVWGQLFKSLGAGGEGVASIRVQNLNDYIKSIQRK